MISRERKQKKLNERFDVQYKDIYNDGVVDVNELNILIKSINDNACYDKVGDNFYALEDSISNQSVNHKLVRAFLDDLELRSATSKAIGYQTRVQAEVAELC